MRVEYTSKASPRSNHRDPNAAAASSCTPAYTPKKVRSVAVVDRSGSTSSSQVNANRPTAAGQYPSPAGIRHSPSSGRMRIAVVSPRCSVRSGFSARQTGPNSSEAGTRPTQNRTKTKPAVGFSASSGPNTAAIATNPVTTRPASRSSIRKGRPSSTACTRGGSGRPASSPRSRELRQSRPRARKDTITATAAPATA